MVKDQYVNDLLYLEIYILDFYNNLKKIGIELDGGIHNDRVEYDQKIDLILKNMGIEIIRFKNEELDDLKKVKEQILYHLEKVK